MTEKLFQPFVVGDVRTEAVAIAQAVSITNSISRSDAIARRWSLWSIVIVDIPAVAGRCATRAIRSVIITGPILWWALPVCS